MFVLHDEAARCLCNFNNFVFLNIGSTKHVIFHVLCLDVDDQQLFFFDTFFTEVDMFGFTIQKNICLQY